MVLSTQCPSHRAPDNRWKMKKFVAVPAKVTAFMGSKSAGLSQPQQNEGTQTQEAATATNEPPVEYLAAAGRMDS